jgi:hypothetical protein
MFMQVRSRVASLTYTVTWLDDRRRVSDDAEAIQVAIRGFDCRLVGGVLTAAPGDEDEYADPDSARDVLEPGLHAWEAHSEIVAGLPFRFSFTGSNSECVDEHGNPGQGRVAVMADVAWAVEAESVARDRFPGPDAAISVQGVVTSSLRSRWRSMEAGHEPLQSCASWLLGRIEREFGPGREVPAWRTRNVRRETVGTNLRVDPEVLHKVGDLSSASDPDHGRKVSPDPTEDHPLTGSEVGWLHAAGKLLIRRVLEHEAGVATLCLLTMNDLPSL